MNRITKKGESQYILDTSSAPRHKRVIHIFTNEFILNSNRKNVNSKYNLMSNSSTSNNSIKNETVRKSGQTPKTRRLKNFSSINQLCSLNTRYKRCIKNSTIYIREYELLQKKIKILEAEELKNVAAICHSQEMTKKKEKRKNDFIKEKTLIESSNKLKEKEMKEKKNKVKDLRDKENGSIIQRKIHRKIHSDNLALKKNEMKKKLLEDWVKERDKRNKENKRKIDIKKKQDEEILKRKKENELRQKKIAMEQIEKEIKLQEQFNRKIMAKIYKFQKIGLKKIDRLQNFK